MARRIQTPFKFKAAHATSVALAGTFNGWDDRQTVMAKGQDDLWMVTIPLAPGRYEYRFVVDDQWVSDPNATESVANPHGGDNSVIVVGKSKQRT